MILRCCWCSFFPSFFSLVSVCFTESSWRSLRLTMKWKRCESLAFAFNLLIKKLFSWVNCIIYFPYNAPRGKEWQDDNLLKWEKKMLCNCWNLLFLRCFGNCLRLPRRETLPLGCIQQWKTNNRWVRGGGWEWIFRAESQLHCHISARLCVALVALSLGRPLTAVVVKPKYYGRSSRATANLKMTTLSTDVINVHKLRRATSDDCKSA